MIIARSLAVALVLAMSAPCLALEPSAASPLPSWLAGGGPLLPIVSKDRLTVTVFSAETSRFAQVKLDAPLPGDALLVGKSGFAVFQAGGSVFAINAVSGDWARLEVSGAAQVDIHMNEDFVVVFDQRGMFVFGRKASAWYGIDPATGAPVESDSAVY